MNLCRTTAVLSAELLEEKVVPMGPCENAGQPDEVPVVVGHAVTTTKRMRTKTSMTTRTTRTRRTKGG